ncbi:MAG: DUF1700 domain-containing protein [Clostridiales bacterium]|nr:DUF1700 domain-containing protein [Clostridiales bacterium]
MTKYEWEHELKKNIHRLPSDEIARVLDYYNEMFEDNIERGKSERDIINEFGNPVDVADKILSEYDGELLPNDGHIATPFDAPSTTARASETKESAYDRIFDGHEDNKSDEQSADKNVKSGRTERKSNEPVEREKISETDKRDLKVLLFFAFNVITGFGFVFAAAILWVVLAAFTVAGLSMSVGGVYAVIVSFGPMFTGGFGSGLAQLGIGIACVGLGVILVVCCVKLIRLYVQVTKKIFNGIFKVGKKERA